MLLTWAPSNGLQAVVALNPQAWFRYGLGITVTGAGVSTWADQSGNGRDLLQGTDAARPTLQADGSILCDGIAQFIKCVGFTFNQPETVYVVFKAITFTDGDTIFDGNAGNDLRLFQVNPEPNLAGFAGSQFGTGAGPVTGVYGVVCAVYNGASSLVRVNNEAPVSGDSGAANGSGFTLGAFGNGATAWSNIQVKEVILFATAHTTTQQDQVMSYLSRLL